jgi:hypothetical protein
MELKLSGKGQSKLKLSGSGNECKPLPDTPTEGGGVGREAPQATGEEFPDADDVADNEAEPRRLTMVTSAVAVAAVAAANTSCAAAAPVPVCPGSFLLFTPIQGLTLAHISAQLERLVWDRGVRGGIV